MAADEDLDSYLELGVSGGPEAGIESSAKDGKAGEEMHENGKTSRADKEDHKDKSSKPSSRDNGDKERDRSRKSKKRSRSRERRRSRSRSRDRKRSGRDERRRRHSGDSSSRSSRHRDRDEDRHRRRHRSRSRSRDRHSSRRSHGSRRRRSRSRSGSRGRRRSRDRDDRRRRRRSPSDESSDGDSGRSRSRTPSNSVERAQKEKERELAELTRDHRTVFVSQLQVKVRERDIRTYFEKIGKVVKVLLIKDKYTNRSKGFAYVEMKNLEDVPQVLMLNGVVPDFQVFPLAVKASEAEKNYAAKIENAQAKSLQKNEQMSGASRVYVGNLHPTVTDAHLKAFFSNWGEVLSVTINRDSLGASRGYGFVQYGKVDEAKAAISKAAGLELLGNILKVGPVNDGSGSTTGAQGGADGGGGSWRLDDDEGSGMQMSAQSRTALMAKLAGGQGLAGIPGMSASLTGAAATTTPSVAGTGMATVTPAAPAGPPPILGIPSPFFALANMFDLATETEEDWDVDIQGDVEDECSKYGKVVRVKVETVKPGGLVYVQFGSTEDAAKCAAQMNGRWFAGRMVTVKYLTEAEFGALSG